MSQYKISKKRLAEIIKEEYRSLSEDSALTRTMSRWADEAKDIPKHLTVARMIEDGNLDGAIEAIQDMKVAQAAAVEVEEVPANVEAIPYNRTDNVKTVREESLSSIRQLIQQELKNL